MHLKSSYIHFAARSSKQRHLAHETFLQAHQHITFHISSIMHSFYSPSLPSYPSQKHQPQRHHPICLIRHQPIRHIHRHRHSSSAHHRRHCYSAVSPMIQRRQHHLGGDGLVFIRHKNWKLVIVNGHALVGISCDDCELHGGRDERRGWSVELVDGGADELELWFVGTVD